MGSIPAYPAYSLESLLMPAQTISFYDLMKIADFKQVTLNHLAPFSEDMEITLDFEDRREVYSVYVSAENQPKFSKWLIEGSRQ